MLSSSKTDRFPLIGCDHDFEIKSRRLSISVNVTADENVKSAGAYL